MIVLTSTTNNYNGLLYRLPNYMKAYKATDSKMRCLTQQFELGIWYEIPKEQELELCVNGFHFCTELFFVQKYYPVTDSRFFEVEIDDNSEIIFSDVSSVKGCARRIKFIRELTFYECMRGFNKNASNEPFLPEEENTNTGFFNVGHNNFGNNNRGNNNQGNDNRGNDNYGNYNRGNDNRGNDNFGNNNRSNNNQGQQ